MQIKRVRDTSELASLAGIWDTALKQSASDRIFYTYDWFISWWENLSESMNGGGSQLEVLVFQEEKHPERERKELPLGTRWGIAPLIRREASLSFLASQEVSDYCDFIFPEGQENGFFGKMVSFLQSDFEDITKLELINLPSSSPTLEYLPKAAAAQGWRSAVEESEETPVLPLPVCYEEYLGGLSRKNRHELKRKVRKIGSLTETDSLGGIKAVKYERPDDVSSRIGDFIQLHEQSGPEKAHFWSKPGMKAFFADMSRRFAEKRWLELRFLYMEGRIVAALISFIYGGILSFYNMAFDPGFAAYSPGYYLLDWSLREAITEKREAADFLRGAERYKYEFGAQKGKIYNLILER
jgi:hypothetical protein